MPLEIKTIMSLLIESCIGLAFYGKYLTIDQEAATTTLSMLSLDPLVSIVSV